MTVSGHVFVCSSYRFSFFLRYSIWGLELTGQCDILLIGQCGILLTGQCGIFCFSFYFIIFLCANTNKKLLLKFLHDIILKTMLNVHWCQNFIDLRSEANRKRIDERRIMYNSL